MNEWFKINERTNKQTNEQMKEHTNEQFIYLYKKIYV